MRTKNKQKKNKRKTKTKRTENNVDKIKRSQEKAYEKAIAEGHGRL